MNLRISKMAYTLVDSFVADGLFQQRIKLDVPLDYASPGKSISIVANIVQKHSKIGDNANINNTNNNGSNNNNSNKQSVVLPPNVRPLAYLQGGPGFSCPIPSNDASTKIFLDKGYTLIFYDQRGTGLSSPIEAYFLASMSPQDAEQYLLHFRADNIVRDMEEVRRALFGSQPWALIGQSYGGFCCFTYLSLFAALVSHVLVTGGVPPIGKTPDDVYRQTYKRTAERNAHYYNKYPQDVARVRAIVAYLRQNRVVLPNGGILSVERFQLLGLRMGAHKGTDGLHVLVTELWYAIETAGAPTYASLNAIQNDMSFDTNIIYALFQEAIYCEQGTASRWAADRMRYEPENTRFVVSDELLRSSEPVYFTGEMVYRLMFDDYTELRKVKELALLLHERKDWAPLYNPAVLRSLTWNDVPIVSATYYHDQYVDFDLTMAVKRTLFADRNLRQYITSDTFHNGLRAHAEQVLESLFSLLECDVD